MNILHIISSSNFGGAENYLYLLSKYQKNRGHSLFFYKTDVKRLTFLLKTFENQSYTVKIKNSVSPFHIAKLLKIIRKNRIELIHTHLSKASVLGGIVGKIAKIPVVSTVHGMNNAKDYRFSDYLIAVSEGVADNLRKTGAKKKIFVVHNGVEQKCKDKKEKFFEDSILKLVYVGRISAEKGIFFLIDALSEWKYKNWRLTVVGGGKDSCAAKNFVSQDISLGLKIKFAGFQNDIKPFLKAADFVILPSFKEGFGLALVEGFSCGVPGIGAKTGGIPEIISDGENGFLFESGNKESLYGTLEKILIDKKFEYWGQKSFETYLTKFSIEKMGEKTLEVYEKAISDYFA